MRPRTLRLVPLAIAAFTVFGAGALQAQEVREGALTDADTPFEEGEGRVADSYTFEASIGQYLTVSLRSGEFDTYLRVVSPAGVERDNDDSGMGTDSQLSFVADETGTWTVYASAYSEGYFI